MQCVNFIHFTLSKKSNKVKQNPFLYIPELSVAAELCSICETSEKVFSIHKSVYNIMSEELMRNTFCIK